MLSAKLPLPEDSPGGLTPAGGRVAQNSAYSFYRSRCPDPGEALIWKSPLGARRLSTSASPARHREPHHLRTAPCASTSESRACASELKRRLCFLQDELIGDR